MSFAGDIVRMLIVSEMGGLYMDLDFYIQEWNDNIHHYFDFVGFNNCEYEGCRYKSLATWGFASKPDHEITKGHLEFFRNAFHKKLEDRPFYYNICYDKQAMAALYNTGPPYFGMIYYKHQNINGN